MAQSYARCGAADYPLLHRVVSRPDRSHNTGVTRLQTLVPAAGLLVVAVLSAPVSATAPALPKDVEQYLLGPATFSAAEVASLEADKVIAKLMPGAVDTEVITVAAVKIRATRKQTVSYYGQMIAYVDGKITTGFGRFSNPPVLNDVRAMSLDAGDIAQLKACQPHDCDLRVGGTAITKARAAVNWSGPDPAGQVNALLRQSAVDYVTAYLKRGDDALLTYDDRQTPVNLKEQWLGLLSGSPYLQQYSPALREYLTQYPRKPLAGATDILYWVNETYTGMKPVISLVHGVIYDAPGQPDRTVVVQKQLYASHYYDGSLALAMAVDAPGGAATYLIYGNRSRGDMLKGGFGGLKRKIAGDQGRKAAVQTLTTIKTVLEKSSR